MRVWGVKRGFLRQIEAEVLHIAGDADNRDPLNLRIARPANPFAEWIFIRKILAHEFVIRDADERRFLVEILGAKISPLLQRNLHDFEVVTENTASFDTRFVAGCDRRPAFNQEIMIERVAAEWKFTDHRGVHTRK